MKKLKENELVQLRDFQTKKGKVLMDIGSIETQKQVFLNSLNDILIEESKFKEELENTYGVISVNLDNGHFEEVKEDDGES